MRQAPIDPRGVEAVEWSDLMITSLFDLSSVHRLDDPSKWAEWAAGVIQEPSIAKLHPPDPRYFDDWREWAFRFNQVLKP